VSELQRRFSNNNYVLEAAIATDPKHPSFLSYELMKEFADKHSMFGIDSNPLKCQVEVARNMFVASGLTANRDAGEPGESDAGMVFARLSDFSRSFQTY
jgi:hypothetical protein